MTEMRENNVGSQSDRSYLCLVAIYAIHAILLNVVFLQPKFENSQKSVTLMSNYVIDGDSHETTNIVKNTSETLTMRLATGILRNEIASFRNRTNSTVERRKIVVENYDDDDYSRESSTNVFAQQSKSGGAAISFLTAAKTLGVSRLTKNIIDIGKSIVEGLSPAALGIISGCLVFLLTFTENDYV